MNSITIQCLSAYCPAALVALLIALVFVRVGLLADRRRRMK